MGSIIVADIFEEIKYETELGKHAEKILRYAEKIGRKMSHTQCSTDQNTRKIQAIDRKSFGRRIKQLEEQHQSHIDWYQR